MKNLIFKTVIIRCDSGIYRNIFVCSKITIVYGNFYEEKFSTDPLTMQFVLESINNFLIETLLLYYYSKLIENLLKSNKGQQNYFN